MRIKRSLITIIIALAVSACQTLPLQNKADTSPPPVIEASSAVVTAGTVEPERPLDQDNVPAQAETAAMAHTSAEHIHTDIWKRIADNLTLDRPMQRRAVKAKLGWYSRNQDYLDRVAERAKPYIYYIVTELQKRDMPLDLALLPIVESAYHPFAYSPSRASGIWQFIPATGKRYGLKQNWWYDGRRDIVAATGAALDYLQKLHKEFNGDWLLALAAYNSGERKVAREIKRNKRAGKKTDFWSLRLPRETRGYVPSLLAVAELVANSDKYGIQWQAIANEPYFAQVNIGSQLDLSLAARLTDLSMDEVYTLNPAFNRWATAPDGPHSLLLPVEKQALFSEKLAALPDSERINWKRHVIKRGETIGLIAQRYHTSIATIKHANGLRRNLIRAGHSLLIPSSKQPLKHYTLSLDARRFRGLKKTGVGEKYTYKVRRGDTLWDIGRHYGVSIKQLCSWNGIAARSILRPGQKLNMWMSDSGQAIAARPDVSTHTQAISVSLQPQAQGIINYTVKQGDSLWLISKRFGTGIAQIRQWNKLPKGKHLQPGQKLILHRQHLQVKGV